jgi:hypothetical protein
MFRSMVAASLVSFRCASCRAWAASRLGLFPTSSSRGVGPFLHRRSQQRSFTHRFAVPHLLSFSDQPVGRYFGWPGSGAERPIFSRLKKMSKHHIGANHVRRRRAQSWTTTSSVAGAHRQHSHSTCRFFRSVPTTSTINALHDFFGQPVSELAGSRQSGLRMPV